MKDRKHKVLSGPMVKSRDASIGKKRKLLKAVLCGTDVLLLGVVRGGVDFYRFLDAINAAIKRA